MNLKEQFEEFIHSRGFEDYEDFMGYLNNKKCTLKCFTTPDTQYQVRKIGLSIMDDLESTLMFLKKTCTGEY